MGGFRLGFALGCKEAMAALEALKSPIDFNQVSGTSSQTSLTPVYTIRGRLCGMHNTPCQPHCIQLSQIWSGDL